MTKISLAHYTTKQLTIIHCILLAVAGCADNKNGGAGLFFQNLHHKGHYRLAGVQPSQPERTKSGDVERE